MLRKIALMSLPIMLSSCTVYGLTDDYKKLYPEQQRKIIALQSFDKTDSEYIYIINGVQLKEELKKHPKSIVYTFTNGCSSQYCLPMSNYEKYAKENGYKLFLVMNGFGRLQETTKQRSAVFTEPLFVIDSEYYDRKLRNTYSKYFENDLRGQPRNTKNEWQGSLYFFERDQLVKVTRELP